MFIYILQIRAFGMSCILFIKYYTISYNIHFLHLVFLSSKCVSTFFKIKYLPVGIGINIVPILNAESSIGSI